MRGRHLVQFVGAFAKITSYEIAGIKRWYSWGRESNGDYCRSLLNVLGLFSFDGE